MTNRISYKRVNYWTVWIILCKIILEMEIIITLCILYLFILVLWFSAKFFFRTFNQHLLTLHFYRLSKGRSSVLVWAFHKNKMLLLLRPPCWKKPWQNSRRCEEEGGTAWIVPLREWLWTGRARATGPGSAGLLLCSSYVCQGCIRFHMERQRASLGEHSPAGKWAVRKWTIIQNRAPTKGGLETCWL